MTSMVAAACVLLVPVKPSAEVCPPCCGEAAVHATRGVVKAIDATTLIIARTGNRGDIVFTLSPTVQREGAIVVGATVSVRYHDEGRIHIATAVALQQPDG